MTRGHAKALGIIVAVEIAMLALIVGVFLHGQGHTRLPASVEVVSKAQRPQVVPISVALGTPLVGVTRTTALARGGEASTAPAAADSGIVGFRAPAPSSGRVR